MASHLIGSLEELQEYFPANLALDYALVLPFLRRAQDGPLRDAIGAALLTELRGGLHDGEEQTDLRELARRIEANYALAFSLSALSVQLSNLGLNEYVGADQKPVPLAKLQLLRTDLEDAAGEAVEALLEWLELNREFVPAWVSSESCTIEIGQFVATAREFQEHVDIDRSRRRFLKLRPRLRQAEEMVLRPVLGRPLLKAIKVELKAGAVSAASQEILDDYIRPGLANLAIGYDTCDELRVANGAAYLEELRLFLIDHAEDYPLFAAPTTTIPFANRDDSRFFAAF